MDGSGPFTRAAGASPSEWAIQENYVCSIATRAEPRGFRRPARRDLPDDEISEGSVVKGKVVAIEKDMAVIDIGAKTGAASP